MAEGLLVYIDGVGYELDPMITCKDLYDKAAVPVDYVIFFQDKEIPRTDENLADMGISNEVCLEIKRNVWRVLIKYTPTIVCYNGSSIEYTYNIIRSTEHPTSNTDKIVQILDSWDDIQCKQTREYVKEYGYNRIFIMDRDIIISTEMCPLMRVNIKDPSEYYACYKFD